MIMWSVIWILTNTAIHLFWQHNINSKHEYIGQMHLENYEPKNQRDKKDDMRKVFVFTLKNLDF